MSAWQYFCRAIIFFGCAAHHPQSELNSWSDSEVVDERGLNVVTGLPVKVESSEAFDFSSVENSPTREDNQLQ